MNLPRLPIASHSHTYAGYRRLYSVVFFIHFIMYILQYWNAGAAEWRNAGFRSSDYAATLRALRDNQLMTDFCIRFRILLPEATCLA